MESPVLGITDAYELLSGSWEMNLGPLQERQVLLIAETSLQALYRIFFWNRVLHFCFVWPGISCNSPVSASPVPCASWFGPQVLTCRFSEQLMWEITNANNVMFSVCLWNFSYGIRQTQGAGESTHCPLVSCVNVVWRVEDIWGETRWNLGWGIWSSGSETLQDCLF